MVSDPTVDCPDIETSSAQYASRFAGKAGRYLLDTQARTITSVLGDVRPGTALDVGGGHGQLVEPLSSLGWRVTVHGTSRVCEHNLRDLHGQRNCGFLEGSLFDLPAGDRSFDVVLAVRLLAHVPDWKRLIAEMCRVADSSIVVDYPSKYGLNGLSPALFGVKKTYEGNTRPYQSFSHSELVAAFQRHGFRVNREIKQLLVPMVVHRAARGAPLLRWVESAAQAVGLTSLAGSPAILRVDRSAIRR